MPGHWTCVDSWPEKFSPRECVNIVESKSRELCQLFALVFDLSQRLWVIEAQHDVQEHSMQTDTEHKCAEGVSNDAWCRYTTQDGRPERLHSRIEATSIKSRLHKNTVRTWKVLEQVLAQRGYNALASVAEMRQAIDALYPHQPCNSQCADACSDQGQSAPASSRFADDSEDDDFEDIEVLIRRGQVSAAAMDRALPEVVSLAAAPSSSLRRRATTGGYFGQTRGGIQVYSSTGSVRPFSPSSCVAVVAPLEPGRHLLSPSHGCKSREMRQQAFNYARQQAFNYALRPLLQCSLLLAASQALWSHAPCV